MSLRHAITPRDRGSAARTVLIAGFFSLVATAGWEIVALVSGRGTSTPASVTMAVGFAVVLLVGAMACYRQPERVPLLVYPALAVAAPVMTTLIALVTGDGSAAGQVGLVYPVVYAAAHFPPAFAWAIAGFATLASAVIAGSLLPPAAAVGDLVVIAPSIAMATVVLVSLAEHQERLVARLNEMAARDPLTGLATRRELESVAATVLQAPADGARRRTDHGGVGLVLIDVDNFKDLNDRFGHPAGDAALTHIAQIVRSAVRSTDVVARFGGDELAILLLGASGEIERRAGAVHRAVRSTPIDAADGATMTVSVGVAVGPPGRATFAQLYAAADRALYEAKAAGRDAVVTASVGHDDLGASALRQ